MVKTSKKILIEAIKSKIITPQDTLLQVLKNVLRNHLREGDIVVISSKVVAVTQKRIAPIRSEQDFVTLVRREADKIISSKEPSENNPASFMLTLKNNIFIPWAGIDRSNIQKGYTVLWPKNPFEEAEKIQKSLKKLLKLKKLGIIIADSTCTPLRKGVRSIALGYAGFKGVNDLRGQKDLFHNDLKVTQQAMADNLATAACLVMGEANESTPFVLIHGAQVRFTSKKINKNEPVINQEDCLFSPLYKNSRADFFVD